MAKKIRSVAEAIGIIEKEVKKMGAEKESKYCVECNAVVSHYGTPFCRLCAEEFYNEVSIDNDEGEGD